MYSHLLDKFSQKICWYTCTQNLLYCPPWYKSLHSNKVVSGMDDLASDTKYRFLCYHKIFFGQKLKRVSKRSNDSWLTLILKWTNLSFFSKYFKLAFSSVDKSSHKWRPLCSFSETRSKLAEMHHIFLVHRKAHSRSLRTNSVPCLTFLSNGKDTM